MNNNKVDNYTDDYESYDDISEEFNNFMYRVSEVKEIVQKLSSDDKTLQHIAIAEADQLLNEQKSTQVESLNFEDIQIKVKSNRTVINSKALLKQPKNDSASMTQEAFMKEVSRDAESRYKDRCIRTEKMETIKKQATKAFRRGEYEKALTCYNKAIDLIRDSPLLYNNRCITYINLKLYKEAIEDAVIALKLNENCLRSFLLLAKAQLLNGNQQEYDNAMKQAKRVSAVDLDFINDFHAKLTMSTIEDSAETAEESCNASEDSSVGGKIVKTFEVDANDDNAMSSEDSDSEPETEDKKEKVVTVPKNIMRIFKEPLQKKVTYTKLK